MMFLVLLVNVLSEVIVNGSYTYEHDPTSGEKLIECNSTEDSLEIPAFFKSIGSEAFTKCSATSYRFEDGSVIQEIHPNAFLGSNAKSISFPLNFISPPEGFLCNISTLFSVEFAGFLTEILPNSFCNLPVLWVLSIKRIQVLDDLTLDFSGLTLSVGRGSFSNVPIKKLIFPPSFLDIVPGIARNQLLEEIYYHGYPSGLPSNNWIDDYPMLKIIYVNGFLVYHEKVLDVSSLRTTFQITEGDYLQLPVNTFITRLGRIAYRNVFKTRRELKDVIIRSKVPISFGLPPDTWSIPELQTISLNGVNVFLNGVLDLSGLQINTLASRSFENYSGTEIILSPSITALGTYSFYYCANLQRVVIFNSITSIPLSLFFGSPLVSSIVIQGNDIFEGNTLDFTETGITTISAGAFQEVLSIHKLIFDGTSITLQQRCFLGCSNLKEIEFVEIPQSFTVLNSSPQSVAEPFGQTQISTVILPPATLTKEISHLNFVTYFLNTTLEVRNQITGEGNITIDGFTYLNNSQEYLLNCKSRFSDIVIPSTVQSIGESAFDTSSLSSLKFASGSVLKNIHPKAFAGSLFSRVELPLGFVPSFGIFRDHTELLSVTIQEQISTIAIKLFSGCTYLNTVIINGTSLLEDGVLDFTKVRFIKDVGENSFKGVPFRRIVFSSNISASTIDSVGVVNNVHLKEVHFEENPHSFSVNMFEGCSSLENITVGPTSDFILQNSVLNLTSLGDFEIHPDAFAGVVFDTIIFTNQSQFSRYSFAGASNVTTVHYNTLASPSTFVLPHQIRDFPQLLTIYIADDKVASDGVVDFSSLFVNGLGSSAFAEIDSIKSVTVPYSVSSFGTSIFEDCTALQIVTILYPLSDIPDHTFLGCLVLSSLKIGDLNVLSDGILNLTGLTRIGQNAFAFISSIKQIIFPSSVLVVEDGAFSQTDVNLVIFAGILSLVQLKLPSSHPFTDCAKITTIQLSSSQGTQQCSVFQSQLSFAQLFAGSSLSSESWASKTNCLHNPLFEFEDANQFILKKVLYKGANIVIPQEVRQINDDAFSGTNILYVSFQSGSVLSIVRPYAFRNSLVRDITFPAIFTSFSDNYLLQDAPSLETLIFQGFISSLGNNALQNSSNLQSIRVVYDVIFENGKFDPRGTSITNFYPSSLLNSSLNHIIISPQIQNLNSFSPVNFKDLEILELLFTYSYPSDLIARNILNIKGLDKLHTVKWGSETVYLLKDGLLDLRLLFKNISEIGFPQMFSAAHVQRIAFRDNFTINPNWLPETLKGLVYDISDDRLSFPEWFIQFNLSSLVINGHETIFDQKIDFTETTFNDIDPSLLTYISSRFTQVGFPNTLILPDGYFSNSTFLESFEILADVKIIPESFFANCTNLASIQIAGKDVLLNGVLDLRHLESVGLQSFSQIFSIKKIIISGNFSLGDSAFENLAGLKEVWFYDLNGFNFTGHPFVGSWNLENYYFPQFLSDTNINIYNLFYGTPQNGTLWEDHLAPTDSASFSFSQPFTVSHYTPPREDPNASNSGSSSNTAIVIAVVCSIFGLLVIGIVLYFIYKKNYQFRPIFYHKEDIQGSSDELEEKSESSP